MKAVNIAGLIQQATSEGVFLFVESKQLRFKLSVDEFPEPLKQQILANKTQLIEFLSHHSAGQTQPQRPDIKPVIRDGQPLVMSFPQQQLWFLDQLQGGKSANYNMSMALKINGQFDPKVAEQCLRQIIQRHEILRTVYQSTSDAVVQIIREQFDYQLNIVDLSHLTGAEQAEQVRLLANQESRLAFDLTDDLMLRNGWLQLGDNLGVLLFSIHHIASDGWSEGILFDEFIQLYEAFIANKTSPLAQMTLQYADYALWQREYLQGEVLDQQLDFWLKQLGDAPLVHSLVLDHARPQYSEHKGASISGSASADVAAKVRQLALQYQVTPFMLLHAVFSLLLSKHANSDQVVIGTPLANRLHKAIEPLIGYFINTVVLHSNVGEHQNFGDYLGHIKQVNLDAQAHQDVPFEQIIEQLKVPRTSAYNPLFQILMTMDTSEQTEWALESLSFSPVKAAEVPIKFDLNLSIDLDEDGISLAWDYDVGLFKSATIKTFNRHFITLLEAIVDQPAIPLSQLSMLDIKQSDHLLHQLNQRDTQYDNSLLIHQRFEAQCLAHPDAVALVFEQQSLTYQQLNQQANQLAHHLLSLGVTHQTLIGICLHRSLSLVVSILAVLKAGGAYVPLDPSYPVERLQYMLDDSGVDFMLSQSGNSSALNLPSSLALVELDTHDCEQQLATYPTTNPAANPHLPLDQLLSGLAYVIYTSGSTGLPKGVLQTHQNVTRLMLTTEQHFAFEHTDVWTLFHSVAFDFSVWELWGALFYGAKLVIPNAQCCRDPEQFYQLCQQHQVTVLNQTPSAFAAFTQVALSYQAASAYQAASSHDPANTSGGSGALRYVIFGGEALQAESLLAWWDEFGEHQPQLVNMYGITETTVHVTYKALSRQDIGQSVIGQRLADQAIYLLDKHLNPVPVGVVGEIYIGGAGLARGYLNQPELSAQRFIANPFIKDSSARLYRTGDLARYQGDTNSPGQLIFAGRVDDQVKIRGFRIELGEIEHHLSACDQVISCVVMARNSAINSAGNTSGQKSLVAYVQTSDQPSQQIDTIDAIRSRLQQKLPEYMVPTAFVSIEQWPLTPSGKIDKKALPEPGQGIVQRRYVAPVTAIQKQLCQIWQSQLGLAQVGINDNFFTIGGDSIRVLSIVSESRLLGLDYSVRDLFVYPTVQLLSEAIEQQHTSDEQQGDVAAFSLLSDDEKAAVETQSNEDAYPLTVLQQGMIFHNFKAEQKGAYHDVFSFKLQSVWDQDAFAGALALMAQQHDSFRRVFSLDTSVPLQLVKRQIELPLQVEDIRHLSETEQTQLIASWSEDEKASAFDFTRPLYKVVIHQLNQQQFYYHLCFHHALWDGWSVASLNTELFGYYQQLRQGQTPQLSEDKPLPYSHFVALEQQALQSAQTPQYWQQTLEGAQLPWWHSEKRATPVTLDVNLDAIQSGDLLGLAKQLGVQEKTVLLSLHCALMWLIGGEADILTSVVVHGRPEGHNSDKTLGLFLNSLPLRVNTFDQGWAALIQSLEQQLVDIIGHRNYPLAEVQRIAGKDFSASLFNFIDFHVLENVSNDIDVLQVDDFEQTNYQLDADYIKDSSTGLLQVSIKLDSATFDGPFVERIKGYLGELVKAMTTDTIAINAPLDPLKLMGQQQRDFLLDQLNSPAVNYPGLKTISVRFEQMCAQYPERTAVAHHQQTMTYRQVNEQANQLAHYLREHGVGVNTLVGIYARRGVQFLIAILAIIKAGGAYVPLDPLNPRKRIQYMIADSKIDWLLTHTELASTIDDKAIDDKAIVGEETIDDSSSYKQVYLDKLEGQLSHYSTDNPVCINGPDDYAYMIYTSGSTGLPKGALVHHAGALNHIDAEFDVLGFTDQHKNLLAYNFLQSAASSSDVSVWQFLAPVVSGGKTVIVDDMTNMPAMVTAMQVHQVHLIETAPVVMQLLLDYLAELPEQKRQLPDLRWLMSIAEAVPVGLVNRWFDYYPKVPVMNGYGPSEASDDISEYIIRRPLAENTTSVPIGKPLPNLTLYVLNQSLQLQPVGVPGEICVSGVGVGPGYWQNPDKTEQSFVPNPFAQLADYTVHGETLYKTGDLGRWLDNGELEFMGRIDNQVKVRGYRVELGEIEATLAGFKEIGDVAVLVHLNPRNENALAAYLVADRSHQRIDSDQLHQRLAEQLPVHMIPTSYTWLDKMPLNGADKIDRDALPKPDNGVNSDTYNPAKNPIEQQLVSIWATLLDLPEQQLSTRANFFALGGDSIVSIQLISRCARAGLHFSVKDLFAAPTIARLAPLVKASSAVIAEQGPVTGELSLLPIQRDFFTDQIDTHYDNMPMLLSTPANFDEAALIPMITALYQRHDALRLSFVQDSQGQWRGQHQPFSAQIAQSAVIIKQWQQNDYVELGDYATTIESSLILEQAQLFKAVYIKPLSSTLNSTSSDPKSNTINSNSEGRLLLVIHHLVVDGVSWRILLEDLASLYQQWQNPHSPKQPLVLEAKSSSYQQWGRFLSQYADTPTLSQEREHWLKGFAIPVASIRHSALNGSGEYLNDALNTAQQHVGHSHLSLSEAQTTQLLNQCNASYRSQINELLLAGVYSGICRFSAADAIRIDLEGHGREALSDQLDLSQTVGWFTSEYPLTLSLDKAANATPGELINMVKQQYRAIANKGIGFGVLKYLKADSDFADLPRAELVFNYLGQFDSAFSGSIGGSVAEQALFSPADESFGQATSPRRQLEHPLTLNGLVSGGQLQFSLAYDQRHYQPKAMQQLMDDISSALEQLIEHTLATPQGRYSPCDFVLAQVSDEQLDRWQSQHPGPIENLYPITGMQQGLLYHSMLDSSSYITHTVVQFDQLSVADFKQAWQQVTERHGIFRTAFVGLGTPHAHQLVRPEVTLPWQYEDIANLDETAQQQFIDQWRHDDQLQGFSPQDAPLMRLLLVKLSAQTHLLVWSYHHALLDGWSMPLVFADVSETYQAIRQGHKPQLPDIAPFSDYAAWLAEQDPQQANDFWRQTLADVSGITALPLVNEKWLSEQSSMPPASDDKQASGVHRYELNFSAAETEQLTQLAQGANTTVNIIVQLAWSLLLSRYSGDQQVIFGVTTSGRPPTLAGVEGMVGLFINTLPMVVNFDGDQTINQWLAHQHQRWIEHDQYSHVPLYGIQALSPLPPPSQSLFDSILVFENYPAEAAIDQQTQHAELAVNSVNSFEGTDFGISLIAYLSGSFSLTMEVKQSLLNQSQVSQVGSHLRQLLLNLCVDGQTNVASVPMLSEAEHDQLVNQLNPQMQDKSLAYPKDLSIGQLFEHQVSQNPDNIALVASNQSLSYAQLNAQANQLGHYLREQGVTDGTLVGVCMSRSVEQFIAVLAIIKVGAAYVPMDPDYPQARLQYMLDDTAIEHLLVATSDTLALILPPHIRQIALQSHALQTLLQSYASDNLTNPNPVNPAEDLAYVMYTSGSTGTPKGVMVPHLAVVRLVINPNFMTLNSDTRFLQAANFAFDAATLEMWGPLLNGGQAILYPRGLIDPEQINALISEHQVNLLWLSTGLFEQWSHSLNAQSKEAGQLASLQAVLTGGEVLNPLAARQVQQCLPGVPVSNAYGPTENTTFTTCNVIETVSENAEVGSVPIGRAIGGTECYLLSPQHALVPYLASGELCVGGDGLALGYLNNPQLSAQQFIDHPFKAGARLYKTGDRVRYLPDGNLAFIGRIDNQLKIRGFRVEPDEIRRQISDCQGVESAQIVVAQGQKLLAYVMTDDTIKQTEATKAAFIDTLKAQLQQSLPSYMQPAAIILVQHWPLTANGKVNHKALPAPQSNDYHQQHYVAPRSELENQLSTLWSKILQQDNIGVNDHFFEVGGNSLLSMALQREMVEQLQLKVSITDIFSYPSIADMAEYLLDRKATSNDSGQQNSQDSHQDSQQPAQSQTSGDIAVIGMAIRFPDANNVKQYWQNLCTGVESLQQFDDEQLLAAGIDPQLLSMDNYVKSGILLNGLDQFDGDYFGFTPKDVELMDPQQRLLFECADDALLDAGYGQRDKHNGIGVFVGVGDSRYLFDNLLSQGEGNGAYADLAVALGNNKDFVATRLSHKLNLGGPSLNINTACSTSLVAIHQACSSLIDGSSDMAIAGGSSIHQLKAEGLVVVDGDIGSLDGHCRPSDADASGTRAGSGSVVVVLKRLEQALADKDTIHAVIKGSAINNDGADKVGFAAPSVAGQARVIQSALNRAGISPRSIGYVETHGTATKLGDPVEFEALQRAYSQGNNNQSLQYCALGAVKANIGHLDAAAGVAGFIKAVCVVKHQQLPPNIHFTSANPLIDFATSVFYINQAAQPLPDSDYPPRAAISSFGIGGTNAHVIIEAAPTIESVDSTSPTDSALELVLLSAKSATALQDSRTALAKHLRDNPQLKLADIAYTLQQGRQHHQVRSVHSAATVDELLQLLDKPTRVTQAHNREADHQLVFMFPGQGSQYINMAAGLYTQLPLFKALIDQCAQLLLPSLAVDIRQWINTDAKDDALAKKTQQINQTHYTQPLLFSIEYSLAQLWLSWGVTPALMIGHSLGEYVAACIAGVFDLPTALKLITHRSRLMQQTQPGAMLSVPLVGAQLQPLLDSSNCDLAAINGPSLSVASGSFDNIALLTEQLTAQGIEGTPLATSHAYHSDLMQPITADYRRVFDDITLTAPTRPFISNISGELITDAQAIDPQYWVDHLTATVQFNRGIETLLAHGDKLFLEVGPGKTLTALARLHGEVTTDEVFNSIRHKKSQDDDLHTLYSTAGRLWQADISVNWKNLTPDRSSHRVSLPAYPYQRQSYWIEPAQAGQNTNNQVAKALTSGNGTSERINHWYYEPVWQASRVSAVTRQRQLRNNAPIFDSQTCCLLFVDDQGVADQISAELLKTTETLTVIKVYPGSQYQQLSAHSYHINTDDAHGYQALAHSIHQAGWHPQLIVHCWSVNSPEQDTLASTDKADMTLNLYSLFYLSHALQMHHFSSEIQIKLVATGVHTIDERATVVPAKASLSAVSQIITDEYPGISCQLIELTELANNTHLSTIQAQHLIQELLTHSEAPQVVLSDRNRWLRTFAPVDQLADPMEAMQPNLLKTGGVYLISGGLGGIGLALAEYLAAQYQATLILLSRTPIPQSPSEAHLRQEWLDNHPSDDALSGKIRRIAAMQALGAQVICHRCDINHSDEVNAIVNQTLQDFGRIDGCIHAAGVPGGGLLSLKSKAMMDKVLLPKVQGSENLLNALQAAKLDFFVCCSSLASVIGEVGQFDYSAANAFEDALMAAQVPSDTRYISINWDTWAESGMAVNADMPQWMANETQADLLDGITDKEGQQVFAAIMQSPYQQVLVSRHDINQTLAQLQKSHQQISRQEIGKASYSRPELDNEYIEGQNDTEHTLIDLLQQLLSIEPVGIDDDFFQLGGDSLLLVKFAADINATFDISISLKLLYDQPSIRQTAKIVDSLLDLSCPDQVDDIEDVVEEGFI
jgi:amino acid adenylation domain-containing protein/non-ribosomal peptide synthase protein (TIGR01720 family)